MPKPRKGSKAGSQPPPVDERGLFGGLPRALIQRLAIMRRAAPKPVDSVRRQRLILEVLAADQMRCYAKDTEQTGGQANVGGYADTAIRLAEQIRRLAATEHEVTPAQVGGAHFTHDLGPGPGMWGGSESVTIATVSGDDDESH